MAIPSQAGSQGTHLWTQSRLEEFEKGTPQASRLRATAICARARADRVLTTPSTFVWSVAVDKRGKSLPEPARRPPCCAWRSERANTAFTLFETKDLSVQVCVGPDGALYAATLPSGKVYKLNPDATAKQDEASATVVFDASKLDAPTAGEARARDTAERVEVRTTSGT